MTDPDRTVVVVGATGTQGGPVARALLDAGYASAPRPAIPRVGRHGRCAVSGMALPEESVGNPMLDGRIAFTRSLLEDGPTVLVPTGYIENFSAPWSAPHVLAGELRYPLAPNAVNAWVTNADVGASVVGAFAHADAARDQ